MLPFLTERFANPSGSHRFARDARRAVDEARDRVADVIGCRPGEVVFTGCGTEADNAAITGAVQRSGGRPVCPAAEHHAVLHTVERHGGTVVPVDTAGRVRLDALAESLGSGRGDRQRDGRQQRGRLDHRCRRRVGRRARARAGRARAHRRHPVRLLARRPRPVAARRPAVAERAQVRRAQGRRGAGCARRRRGRADHRRRWPGARAAQRHAQRRRHRGDGRGTRRHRRRTGRRRSSGSPPCATAWSPGSSPPSPACARRSPRRTRSPDRPTCSWRASRASRCCTCSTRRASARRRRRRVPAGRWTRRTSSPRWASSGHGRPVRCG